MNIMLKTPTAGSAVLANVEVFSDLALAAPAWRALERSGAVHTPYQRYDWVALWQQHVSARTGTTPLAIVGRSADGEPLFLLPLGVSRRGPANVATFYSGKHANFNFALWRREYATQITAADLSEILKTAGPKANVDLFMLMNQPTHWDGLANPFALLPHQASPSAAHKLRLGAPSREVMDRQLSASTQSRLRKKGRGLEKLPGYRFYRASTEAEVSGILEAFFRQKARRFRVQGLRDVFAEPGVEKFIRDACRLERTAGRPVIELYAIEAEGEPIAICGGTHDGRRFSSMFKSFSEAARHSPGLILTAKVIADCADRGFEFFDLGVGESNYKDVFCNEREPLFDSFLPMTPLGRLAGGALRLTYGLKGKIKTSPALWAAVQASRRLAARVAS
jgi:CelD/BcsL family acetyltransferase involved in cellulose biosynthesis